jgi:putative SOS response-associated peptidase YedK
MCGRYTITINADTVRQDLGLAEMPADYQPRYNVAPTQPVAVVADADERKAEWMRWGLIPFWAKDPTIGSRLINARSETIHEKPAFKNAFAKRRCLVLADGFYEWQKGTGPKGRSQPYFFRRKDESPFAFAGLWEFWRSPEGEEVRSCTIITCDANELVKPVHDRMPAMLSGDDLWLWLKQDRPGDLLGMLKPYPVDQMECYPVSAMVNRPEVETPELVRPVAV